MKGIHEIIGLGILLAWPVIPLFWLPVRLFPGILSRIGKGVYFLTGLLWLGAAALVWHFRISLLNHSLEIPAPIRGAGWIFFVSGLMLQTWTAKVLGMRIIGLPELDKRRVELEMKAPFNQCRHPAYLAHLMIFGGAAMLTGFHSLFKLAALDFLITRLVIIPLEEKELEERFGSDYREYKRNTPCFFPHPNIKRRGH